jgi:hypothetical protein
MRFDMPERQPQDRRDGDLQTARSGTYAGGGFLGGFRRVQNGFCVARSGRLGVLS